jgi:hypothetical protein
MKLKSVASLKGPLACSIVLILKTYFLSLTAMPFRGFIKPLFLMVVFD